MSQVLQEPGYVLHHYDWSESSVIVEAFTQHHGRIALVAKGAKRPSSNFRPVLLPLQPLLLAWGGDGEIRTLKRAEWGGGFVMPSGDALLSGHYANELLLRLLAREDAHPELFEAYADLVRILAGQAMAASVAGALRAFELILLRACGFLPALDAETWTLQRLAPDGRYRLAAETGLDAAPEDAHALPGSAWQSVALGLAAEVPFAGVLDAVLGLPPTGQARLREQLRALLEYHGGVAGFRTRQLAQDLQRLAAR